MDLLFLFLLTLGLVSPYQIIPYHGQILLGEGTGGTLIEKLELCTVLKFKKRDLHPMMYILDERASEKAMNMIEEIDFRDSNVWLSGLRSVSRCSNWNQEMVLKVQRTGSSVGWLNCGFKSKRLERIALGLDLSVMGMISILRKLIGYAFRFVAVDAKPEFPEVRRSVCLSTGLGIKTLKYWAPMSSSAYYDLFIDPIINVLRIRTRKFSSTSQISVTCGCLTGGMHQVNGSVIELKFNEYHSCLLVSVSVAWGNGIIAYKYNFEGPSRPFRAFRGIEIYNPGTPAMLLGVGKLGDENLGAIDCQQNQNDRLWPDYT